MSVFGLQCIQTTKVQSIFDIADDQVGGQTTDFYYDYLGIPGKRSFTGRAAPVSSGFLTGADLTAIIKCSLSVKLHN